VKSLCKQKFNPTDCRREWTEFSNLLSSNIVLDEAKDILPFFKKHHNLSMLISSYFPDIRSADVIAHEYPIYGDFKADLIIGDSSAKRYLLIEFEDGRPDSIFKKKKGKTTPEWSGRFERAFSQIVDWIWKLEDMRSTANFSNVFGNRTAKFHGLIIIGKDMKLSAEEESRLNWRTDRVFVDSHKVSCVSFDTLCSDLDFWLNKYYNQ